MIGLCDLEDVVDKQCTVLGTAVGIKVGVGDRGMPSLDMLHVEDITQALDPGMPSVGFL